MPPMDPGMGGAPPMDPAMGGAPPMDPAAGGAPPDIAALVTQMVQEELAKQGMGAGGAAGGAGGVGGKLKIDPAFIYMELSRMRKMMTHFFQKSGIELPSDILDDGAVAQTVMGQAPESAPIGQEGAPMPGGDAGGGPMGLPGVGQSAPISPIEAPKTAADVWLQGDVVRSQLTEVPSSETFDKVGNSLAALAALSRSLNGPA